MDQYNEYININSVFWNNIVNKNTLITTTNS